MYTAAVYVRLHVFFYRQCYNHKDRALFDAVVQTPEFRSDGRDENADYMSPVVAASLGVLALHRETGACSAPALRHTHSAVEAE